MSFNTRTIAVSVAALMAVAGGAYAFMPGEQQEPYDRQAVGSAAQPSANLQGADIQGPSGRPGSEPANVQVVSATVAGQPGAVELPASQTPKKLTRAQLTPPPATEEEKLQKAAEQESNF